MVYTEHAARQQQFHVAPAISNQTAVVQVHHFGGSSTTTTTTKMLCKATVTCSVTHNQSAMGLPGSGTVATVKSLGPISKPGAQQVSI